MKSLVKSHSNQSPQSEGAIIRRLRSAYEDMVTHQTVAVNKALYLGALLLEAKAIVVHGDFLAWRRDAVPGLSDDRAERYMKAAENTLKQVALPAGMDVPISDVISLPAGELQGTALEAQQLIFDFTAGKTIKDCLAGVVVDGDEPHRITRAANGKKLGGTKGENRKDWPEFIGRHLSDISSHLKNWQQFSPAQVEATFTKYDSAIAQSPTPVLNHLLKRITKELKTR